MNNVDAPKRRRKKMGRISVDIDPALHAEFVRLVPWGVRTSLLRDVMLDLVLRIRAEGYAKVLNDLQGRIKNASETLQG